MPLRLRQSATILAVSAGLAGSCPAGVAAAAELAPLEPYDGQTVSDAVYDWTGFYVGAHGGYGWASAGAADLGGVLGGMQLGYVVQSGSFAAGIEGDIAGTGIDKPGSGRSLDWLGSARLRAGFVFNQYFVYGTGGFGFGNIALPDGAAPDDRWNAGWVAGIGAEVALSRNWTARIEAFHYDLGRADYELAGATASFALTGTLVRAGVNYRF
ncbi:outer membrane protein [Labrys wisconsinensis]|uniref:Outer membrane immunogenic protein n=1 Tax=Labrys wisconsinensis TaxID=425677 RepID=A0ABU0JBR6_9HYPH|nr:outer membrane beta-barrel protein [Labrys wisconsinensis]MDQ0471727.1 outer membrane immunogenic protein [Labrys wisconsinensis]